MRPNGLSLLAMFTLSRTKLRLKYCVTTSACCVLFVVTFLTARPPTSRLHQTRWFSGYNVQMILTSNLDFGREDLKVRFLAPLPLITGPIAEDLKIGLLFD
jgi:hypothetical protein